MKTNIKRLRIPALLLIVVMSFILAAGCGASSATPSANSSAGVPGVSEQVRDNYTEADYAGKNSGSDGLAVAPQAPAASPSPTSVTGGGTDFTNDVSNAILAERKVIRSANLSLEVKDFDEAYSQISSLILGIGYIQSTNISTNKVYIAENEILPVKSGTVVIRVDAKLFDKVLGNVKGIGEVTNESLNSEDVTERYVDIESRLRLLKIEQEKIEEYLKKLTSLDEIYKTESKLTELRYQIESLTTNLKQLSNLVELSTIYINMSEEYPGSEIDPEDLPYGERLLKNLTDSMKQTVKFFGELLVVIVSILPLLVILGIIALIIIVIYKKSSRRQKEYLRLKNAEAARKTAENAAEVKETSGGTKE